MIDGHGSKQESRLDWRTIEPLSFGDSPRLADELAQLVLAGKKTVTCSAAAQGLLTQIGKRMVILDGSGRPRAVIETVELTQRCFLEVDATFAGDEGEGDRTLADWREAHKTYFSRLGQFTPNMHLCERFQVIEIVDGD
jgi:uncharacterized protein YhfF